MYAKRILALALPSAFIFLALPAQPRPEVTVARVGTDRPCFKYDGDGCSIPFGLPFFYKDQFTTSCDRHDVCYHCGVGYDISRATCDDAFRQDTMATCTTSYLSSPTHGPTSNITRVSLVQAARMFGAHSLVPVLRRELLALTLLNSRPSIEDVDAWLSLPKVKVRMVADWIVGVSAHAQRLRQEVGKLTAEDLEHLASLHKFSPYRDDESFSILFSMLKSANISVEDRHKPVFSLSSKTKTKTPVSMVDKTRSLSYPRDTKYILKPNVNNLRDKEHTLKAHKNSDSAYDDDAKWCDQVIAYGKSQNQTIWHEVMDCPSLSYLTCNVFSLLYYLAVAVFGGPSYHRVPEFYCGESFVPGCLPSTDSPLFGLRDSIEH